MYPQLSPIKLLSILVFVSVFTISCSKNVEKKEPQSVDSVSATTKSIPVTVKSVSSQPFSSYLKVSAEFEAINDVTVSSISGGEVEWIGVGVGDKVIENQELAKVDSRLLKSQLDSARAAYGVALSNISRQRTLFTKGLTSTQNFENATYQYQSAKSQFQIAEVNFDNSIIKAPFNATVAAKHINKGQLLSPGSPVFEIVDLNRLKLEVGITQGDISFVKKGQNVSISVPAISRTISGSIHTVGVKAMGQNKTFPVEIYVNNVSSGLRPGMVGEVNIKTRSYENAIVIQQDFVIEEQNSKSVFVVENGKAKRRIVSLGAYNDQKVRITSGLNVGDDLIIAAPGDLASGQIVSVNRKIK
jgi:membrane fusion protein (multidrug efflux system)